MATISSSRVPENVVVSKGHAAAGFYSVLNAFEHIDDNTLDTFGQNGSTLVSHVSQSKEFRIPFSSGSLGHGFPYAVGRAMASKRKGDEETIFCVMSDGELDEGTTWESSLIAAHHRLGNLVVVVDRNRIQSIASTEETLALEPLAEKFAAFGFQVEEIDGHSIGLLLNAFEERSRDRPLVVIAQTTKGKGVSFMENQNLWHYKSPNESEFHEALREIGAGR